MRLFILLFSFVRVLLCSFQLTAQQQVSAEIDRILKITPRLVERYTPQKATNTLIFPAEFNAVQFENAADLATLTNKVIIKIELVFTTFKKNETFDQHALNKKRLHYLFEKVPNIAAQQAIEWSLIGQTACKTVEEGRDFFHGILIKYKELPTPASSLIEQQFIKAALYENVPYYAYETYLKKEGEKVVIDTSGAIELKKEPVFIAPNFVQGERERIAYFNRNLKFPGAATPKDFRVEVTFEVDKDGKIAHIQFPNSSLSSEYEREILRFVRAMPDWKPATYDEKRIPSKVSFTVDYLARGSIIPSAINAEPILIVLPKPTPPFDYSKIRPNSSSQQIGGMLEKLNYEKTILVCDVTGSMAPYNAQVMQFLAKKYEAKDSSIRQIIYFNDGNNRPDKSKKTGQVGGIYVTQPANLKQAVDQLLLAMQAGSGGDLEENVVEALLVAQTSCPDCKTLTLIADNNAHPRDMILANKLNKPIQIILCASGNVLNESYLNLAYKTNGSVLFNGKKISNLQAFEEGGTVQVGLITYVLVNGKFIKKRS